MSFFFLLHALLIVLTPSSGGNDCKESRCSSDGPSIHFPFKLQHQPKHCGYPGFELSCNNNMTILTLPNSRILIVEDIHYGSQKIEVSFLRSCIMRLLHFNLSASPFLLDDEFPSLCNYSIFHCSGAPNHDIGSVACSDTPDSMLIDIRNTNVFHYLSHVAGCEKVDEIQFVPCVIEYRYSFYISWLNPSCSYCEDQGMDCGFKNYTKQLAIQCFDRPGTLKEPLIAGGVLAIVLFGIIVMALYEFYSSNKIERENQARVEKFLEDYRAFRPTRYTYAVIKKITNQFQETLGEGTYGVVYKGTLSNEIHVAVKVLNDFNEVAAMAKIHHVNIVRLVGFCADGVRRALVFEYLPSQSLDKLIYPSSSKYHITLNWKKLQDTAMGIAKGLEYLHQGCDQQILHFDIKPQNILLDHNLNPKISDFGLAKLCSKDRSVVTMTEARGTMGYIAPKVLSSNFGKASHKSDVYSFGMLLLEMVGGRKNFDPKADTSQVNFESRRRVENQG